MGANNSSDQDDNSQTSQDVSESISQVPYDNVPVEMAQVDMSTKYAASNDSVKSKSRYNIEL